MKLKKAVRAFRTKKGESDCPMVYDSNVLTVRLGNAFKECLLDFPILTSKQEEFLSRVFKNAKCGETGEEFIYSCDVNDLGSKSLEKDIGISQLLGLYVYDRKSINFIPLFTKMFVSEGVFKVYVNRDIRVIVTTEGEVILVPFEKGMNSHSIKLANYLQGKLEVLQETYVEIDFKRLRKMGIPKSYLRTYSELDRSFLQKAVSSINASCRFCIDDYGKMIEDRKTVGVWFSLRGL